MNKISIIIKREYLSRTKKKSFIVMTILGPLLMAALMVAPALIATLSDTDYKIAIVDDSKLFYTAFENTNQFTFSPLETSIDSAKLLLEDRTYDAILHIPDIAFQSPASLRIFSQRSVNVEAKSHVETILENEFEGLKLTVKGIDPQILMAVETPINISAIRIDEAGQQAADHPEVRTGLGFLGGFMIYMFIFLFGSQVLRGVLEEKTNRIVEIIVSSVKPFQLMMGKILGVGLVGLTQFVIWVVFTGILVFAVRSAFPDVFAFTPPQEVYAPGAESLNPELMQERLDAAAANNTFAGEIMEGLAAINYPVVLLAFLFYFLGGFLLYAAMFAAIGSAVDNEADTQQFMLPVTIPLIFGIVMMQSVLQNPDGPLAFWLSIIPFTSPIIMMIRIPFGVPMVDVALSATLLILGFIATTWLAGKIYRTGILMYGKKIDYAELWKWIRYR
ncbi:MAG TPA: ABC transporter permease [Bacteroidales bacterium]|nr:ABC transporter permease [Bacteroidales bacterium]